MDNEHEIHLLSSPVPFAFQNTSDRTVLLNSIQILAEMLGKTREFNLGESKNKISFTKQLIYISWEITNEVMEQVHFRAFKNCER